MANLGHADRLGDLVVYQRARSVAKTIFELSKAFPKEETFSLTDQLRRSSRSIGAQIAEAWAKRRYEKHFVSKLTDADAEQHEAYYWVDIARECGYLELEDAESIMSDLSEIGRMLNSMINKAALFCSNKDDRICESPTEYITEDDEI